MSDLDPGFWAAIRRNFASGDYWAGEVVSWLVLTVLVTALVTGALEFLRWRREKKYSGWTLRVVGFRPDIPTVVQTTSDPNGVDQQPLQDPRIPERDAKPAVIEDFHVDEKLYSEDVKRFLGSDLELWRMVKSVASGPTILKVRSYTQAKNKWVFEYRDARTKMIIIDFFKIPDDHVKEWNVPRPVWPPKAVP